MKPNNEERKGRRWALILGAAGVAAAIIGLIAVLSTDPEGLELPDDDESPATAAFGEWLRELMPRYDNVAEMTADGFEYAAGSLGHLLTQPAQGEEEEDQPDPEADARAAVSDRLDSLLAAAERIRTGVRVSEAARAAAEMTADVASALQEYRYTSALVTVGRLRGAAQEIEPGVPLDEQRDEVEAFFREAYDAVRGMDVPVTPPWIDRPFVMPWPSPTGPDI